jgi:hypothetical protein
MSMPGNLSTINGYLQQWEGGLVPPAQMYHDAVEGQYEDGDELIDEDDDYEYYACGGAVGYSIGGKIKKGIKKVAKVGKFVAPLLGKIPGIGTVAGGVIGGLSGLIADGNLKGALSGALSGVSGGLSTLAGLGASAGSSILDMSNAKGKAKKAAARMAANQPPPLEMPKYDLAALHQQALGAQSSQPSALARVQQTMVPPMARTVPGSQSQGLLQRIQQAQAARAV